MDMQRVIARDKRLMGALDKLWAIIEGTDSAADRAYVSWHEDRLQRRRINYGLLPAL